jgi:DNA-directed RNA polymerase specialized sigma24 family protein
LDEVLQHPDQGGQEHLEGQPVLQAVLSLPEKYRTVLVLHGLEGQPVDILQV